MHILSLIAIDEGGNPTSGGMAGSIGVNPVIVRNVMGMLRRAGLVRTQQGVAGAELVRPLSQVTLLDVYRAVEEERELFSVHLRPNPNCPIRANIQGTLERVFGEAQEVMEAKLAATTVSDIVRDLRALANCEAPAPLYES